MGEGQRPHCAQVARRMEPLKFDDLPDQALLLIDSSPIIYVLEGQAKFGPRFKPLFEAHAIGRLRFAVTTITIAEVLTGPLQASDEVRARRYRSVFESWQGRGTRRRYCRERREAAGFAPPQSCRCSPGRQRTGDQRHRPGDA